MSEIILSDVTRETTVSSVWRWFAREPDSAFLTVFFPRVQARIERLMRDRLGGDLAEDAGSLLAPTLVEAMRYSVLNGGKRLRPALVYATYLSLAPTEIQGWSLVDDVALAIELLHGYSLVHDDLPAMDDDDLRRGKPTCHRVYGEATAILAGDALQSLAFEVLAGAGLDGAEDAAEAAIRLQLIRVLALASGTSGMAAGQALDLAATGQRLTIEDVRQIHALKTGRLLQASVEMAARTVPTVCPQDLRVLRAFAAKIGLAFQIQDDILDEIGETDKLGKVAGADQARQKATYPALMGLRAAEDLVQQVFQEALAVLGELSVSAQPLTEIAAFIVSRDH